MVLGVANRGSQAFDGPFTLGSGGRTECEVCSEIGFKPNSGNTGAKLGTKDAKEVEFHQPGNVGKQKH
jgi:hypothetical protein